MNSKYKYLKRIAVALIILWLIRPLLFNFFRIDFATEEYLSFYKSLWLFLLPSAIIILMLLSWKKDSSALIKGIASVVVFIGVFFFVSILNIFSTGCVRTFSEPDFTSTQVASKLKIMDVSCGAWDSDRPLNELVELSYITKYLIHYKKVEEKLFSGVDFKKSRTLYVDTRILFDSILHVSIYPPECPFTIENALKDIKKDSMKIVIQGGISGFGEENTHKSEEFQSKYKLEFEYVGCVRLWNTANEDLHGYNDKIFEHLRNKYGVDVKEEFEEIWK